MPTKGKTEIEGLPELRRAISMILDDLSKDGDGLAPAHRKASDRIRAGIAPFVPRLTGRLGASLVASSTPTSAEVSSDLIYAGVINHGWPRHHISAANFMIDGARASEASWLDDYSDGIQDVIDHDVIVSGAASIL